eukprot:gene6297-12742_t
MFQFSLANLNQAVQVLGNIIAPLPDDGDEINITERSSYDDTNQNQQQSAIDKEDESYSYNRNTQFDQNDDFDNDEEGSFIQSSNSTGINNYNGFTDIMQESVYNKSYTAPILPQHEIGISFYRTVENDNNISLNSEPILDHDNSFSTEDLEPSYQIHQPLTPIDQSNEIHELTEQLHHVKLLYEKEVNKNIELKTKISNLEQFINHFTIQQTSFEKNLQERNTEILALRNKLEAKNNEFYQIQNEYTLLQQKHNEHIELYNQLENIIAITKNENGELIWAMQVQDEKLKDSTSKIQLLEAQISSNPSLEQYKILEKEYIELQEKYQKIENLYLASINSSTSTTNSNSSNNNVTDTTTIDKMNNNNNNNNEELYKTSYQTNILKLYNFINNLSISISNHIDSSKDLDSPVASDISCESVDYSETNKSNGEVEVEVEVETPVEELKDEYSDVSNQMKVIIQERDIALEKISVLLQEIEKLKLNHIEQINLKEKENKDNLQNISDLAHVENKRLQDELKFNEENLRKAMEDSNKEMINLKELHVHTVKELENSNNSSSILNTQLMNFKLQLQKTETENRQLHQVIAQLRQVRKVSKEDIDSIIIERDEFKKNNEVYIQEIDKLKQSLSSLNSDKDRFAQVWIELTATRDCLTTLQNESEKKIQFLESNSEELRRVNGQLQQREYEIKASLEASKADHSLLEQDIIQLQIEIKNLNNAIKNTQNERDVLKNKLNIEKEFYEDKIKEIKILEQNISYEKNKIFIDDLKSKISELQQEVEDSVLIRRKMELEMNQEKLKMQKAMTVTIEKLHNNQEDNIDRALIKNLIITYFRRNRSTEVMGLISRILNFNDDEKITVGLKSSNTLLSSIFSNIIGVPHPVEVEGDNLAELWHPSSPSLCWLGAGTVSWEQQHQQQLCLHLLRCRCRCLPETGGGGGGGTGNTSSITNTTTSAASTMIIHNDDDSPNMQEVTLSSPITKRRTDYA